MDRAALDRQVDAVHRHEALEFLGQARRGQDDVVAHFLPIAALFRVLAPGVLANASEAAHFCPLFPPSVSKFMSMHNTSPPSGPRLQDSGNSEEVREGKEG